MLLNITVGAVGSIINGILTRGLLAFERSWPMPERLGASLPPQQRARPGADPVILVSGFANTPAGWEEWVRSLRADGFKVFVVDLKHDGLGDMNTAADEVAAFVADVKRKTGARKVDLVGFSEGGLLDRMFIAQRGGASSVDRAISLATPHHGFAFGSAVQRAAKLLRIHSALPASLWQMIEGCELLTSLDQAEQATGVRAPDSTVRWASVYSQVIDGAIAPWSSALEGAVNIPVTSNSGGAASGPNHFAMFHLSDRAYEAIRALLLDRSDAEARRLGQHPAKSTLTTA